MQIFILDDETRSALRIQALLEGLLPKQANIKVFQRAEEFLNAVHLKAPDLVFMNMWLQRISAFDVLDKLPVRPFPIVFTSASKEFAIQAFQYGASGFLLKPIQTGELLSVLKRMNTQIPMPFG